LQASREFAAFLPSRAAQLTAKDVSQAIWACGRLGFADWKIVCAFAYRARQVSPGSTSCDIANILWGLSKVGHNDREVISALTDRMMDLGPTAQEAATVMFSLGRMEIQDEVVFSSMSTFMMEQLETASAQSVANALFVRLQMLMMICITDSSVNSHWNEFVCFSYVGVPEGPSYAPSSTA
jgi:hypothetical protein